jgi:lipoprotein-anchoring transpeptidase ErfK/SrfK
MMRLAACAIALAMLAVGTDGALSAPARVSFDRTTPPGTIVVKTAQRRLFFVVGTGVALRYPVAVGRLGKQWSGVSSGAGKYVKPAWSPPAEVLADNPRLPRVIPGGAPSNPMGVAALTLARPEYAIHGTNRPGSIGTFASYGCIRMYNADIQDLFGRVHVGTPVVVTP